MRFHGAAGFAGLLALAACSVSDVGEVSIKKARVATTGTCAGQTTLVGMAEVRGGADPIVAGEHFSVRLRRGFISEFGADVENIFTDLSPNAEGLGETSVSLGNNVNKGPNLEILVIARTLDYGADKDGFRTRIDTREDARVIYSSSDVYKKQILSFENLPVVGPVKYSGAGFGLQLLVLEIDTETETQRALVSGVVEASQVAASLSSSGLGGTVLTTVLKRLIDNGNTDDRMFEFSAGWDTGHSGGGVEYVRFETGLYAAIADYERDQAIFDNRALFIDPRTARLLECVDGAVTPFTGGTYFILQILKSPEGAESKTTFETVAEARSALRTNGLSDESLTQLQTDLVAAVAGEEVRRKAMTLLRDAQSAQEAGDFRLAGLRGYQLGDLLYTHRIGGMNKIKFTSADAEFVLTQAYVAAGKAGDALDPAKFTAAAPDKGLNKILQVAFSKPIP